MTKLTEIEALADAAIQYEQDNPDCDDGIRKRLDYLADELDPQTVKALIALCKQQHEALLYTGAYAERGKALAAFKEFNK
jgi:hypothetical protein